MLKLPTIVALGLCAAMLGASGAAQAATVTSIGNINIPGLSFEVTSTAGSVGVYGLNTSATGTSNGIGWTAEADTASGFNYGGYTCTNNCYSLPSPSLSGAPATDRLHASYDFTITFGQTINWFLVVFSNDSTELGGFDFGMAPTQVGGGVTTDGTKIKFTNPATTGGWALFTGLNTTTLSHDNWYTTPVDGYHVAWFAGAAPVPLPAAAWLLLSGLAGFGFVARRRTAA